MILLVAGVWVQRKIPFPKITENKIGIMCWINTGIDGYMTISGIENKLRLGCQKYVPKWGFNLYNEAEYPGEY